jgi:type IV secretory pathway TraG/TraD family ATPase VirD4
LIEERRAVPTLLASADEVIGSRLVSDLLGQETVVFQTMSRALDAEATGISLNQQLVGRALMTPDEIRNLPAPIELLFVAEQRPTIARKIHYFEEREFKGAFDPACRRRRCPETTPSRPSLQAASRIASPEKALCSL